MKRQLAGTVETEGVNHNGERFVTIRVALDARDELWRTFPRIGERVAIDVTPEQVRKALSGKLGTHAP